jgi:hypothetical protein
MNLSEQADHLIDQLGLISTQFNFYETECCKLDAQAKQLQDNNEHVTPEGEKKLDLILNKLDELYTRYQRDRDTYIKLIKEANDYFVKKYKVNLNLDDLI